nr:hypothetical protein [Burkholderia ambifaria]
MYTENDTRAVTAAVARAAGAPFSIEPARIRAATRCWCASSRRACATPT